MKVLYIVKRFCNGGVEKIISDYIKNLPEDIEISLFVYEQGYLKGNVYEKDILERNVKLEYKDRFIGGIYELIKNNDYDVIHYCISTDRAVIYSFLINLINKLFGKTKSKLILHGHNAPTYKITKKNFISMQIKRLLLLTFAKILKSCNLAIACSKTVADNLFFGKAKVHYSGVNVEKCEYNSEGREKLGLCSDDFIIGHIGRMEHQKNPLYLIDIFNEVIKLKTSKLLYIGEGELESSIRNRAKELGIYDSIIWVQRTDKIEDYLSAMDCFLLPSFYEGLPLVALEAQSAGLPTFLSNNIDKGVEATDLVKFLDIKREPREWAEAIVKTNYNINRKQYSNKMRGTKYDYKEGVKEIYNIYKTPLKDIK